MKTLEYTVRFTTPAFLGNAEQSGQWRTPPFKALLRQWWRLVWAANHDFREDIPEMRKAEARLFGAAADQRSNTVNRKSLVRLRLDKWSEGLATKQRWGDKDAKVQHPEVGKNGAGIGSLLYLGYGPLETSKGSDGKWVTNLKQNAAIQVEECATLSIAAPARHIPSIRTALALVNAYGAVGARSRNGWGSFFLTPVNETSALTTDLAPFFRPWQEALTLDWPHAIGQSREGPLVWQTSNAYRDWEQVMRDLAVVKIGMRTQSQFGFRSGKPHPQPEDRHWLSYPVTRHAVKGWGNAKDFRLPNSLRFKVRPDPSDGARRCGIIFHVPCLPPKQFQPDRQKIKNVWRKVHDFLDQSPRVRLTRIST